jgi:hypothetical protein
VNESSAEVVGFLTTMLEADGYSVVVHDWPKGDVGHAKIEIVAGESACEECLVPKDLLATIIAGKLPVEVVLEPSDILYPSDRVSSKLS